jgi:hypothetical protein
MVSMPTPARRESLPMVNWRSSLTGKSLLLYLLQDASSFL